MPRAEAVRRVLVVGGTGCVGRALVSALLRRPDLRVRVMSRRSSCTPPSQCEFFRGDVRDAHALRGALSDVDIAYYLVHSLNEPGYPQCEYAAARTFAAAASACRRIVYLGALGDERQRLSPHIRSRHVVGQLLRRSAAPVVELRASVVLGADSAVFRLISELAERVPLLIVPKGANKRCQPIALEDVVRWLITAALRPDMPLEPLEIGGPQALTYHELMKLYVNLRRLHRPIVRMPVSTPRLSGWWIGAFTGVSVRMGRELVRGLEHDAVVRDDRANAFVDFESLGVREAMRRAIGARLGGPVPC